MTKFPKNTKCPIFGPFCPNKSKKEFSGKNRLYQFLDDKVMLLQDNWKSKSATPK